MQANVAESVQLAHWHNNNNNNIYFARKPKAITQPLWLWALSLK